LAGVANTQIPSLTWWIDPGQQPSTHIAAPLLPASSLVAWGREQEEQKQENSHINIKIA